MSRRSVFKLLLAAGIVMISCALALGIWWASIRGKHIDTALWKVDRGRLDSVSFSPDGQTIVATCNSHLCFFDAATGKLENSISMPVGYPKVSMSYLGPVYSHDGKWIAVPGYGGIVIIDSQTTETERNFDIPEAQAFSVRFNQDDTQLLTSDSRHQIIIWDVATGEKLISWETGLCSDYGCWLSATFSPDGEQVVTTDAAGHVILWDASNGEVIREFIGYEDIEDTVMQAHFDTEGRKLATVGYWKGVRVWDVESGELLYALEDLGWFSDAEFSPDGKYIAVPQLQPDPTRILLYDAETGELVYSYSGYSEYLYDVAFHPNEPWFVAAGEPYIVNYLLPDAFPDN